MRSKGEVLCCQFTEPDFVHFFYVCETWPLTLWEEQHWGCLRVEAEKIFGPEREEVIGDWRKLYNEELRDLYCSPNTSRMNKSKGMRGLGHVACRGGILVGEPEGKRSLGRPSCKWKGNIETILKQIGWVGVDWIDLAQDRGRWQAVVNIIMNFVDT